MCHSSYCEYAQLWVNLYCETWSKKHDIQEFTKDLSITSDKVSSNRQGKVYCLTPVYGNARFTDVKSFSSIGLSVRPLTVSWIIAKPPESQNDYASMGALELQPTKEMMVSFPILWIKEGSTFWVTAILSHQLFSFSFWMSRLHPTCGNLHASPPQKKLPHQVVLLVLPAALSIQLTMTNCSSDAKKIQPSKGVHFQTLKQ